MINGIMQRRVDATNTIYQRLDPHRLAQKLTINDITSPIKTILLNIDEKDFDEVVTYLATNAPSLSLINHSNELNIDITNILINLLLLSIYSVNILHMLHSVTIIMILKCYNMLKLVIL